MTSRRDVLKVGLAVAARLPAARATFAGATPLPLYKVLSDTRSAASIPFARRAEARGLAVQTMAGDMTRFWYDDLYHAWRRGPVPIAGLTAHGALFCLERLAWEQRMRVVYRGEHTAAGGRVAHRFNGPGEWVSAAADAIAAPAWAAALADVVAERPRGGSEVRTVQSSTPGAAEAALPEALFSWVIAPVLRA